MSRHLTRKKKPLYNQNLLQFQTELRFLLEQETCLKKEFLANVYLAKSDIESMVMFLFSNCFVAVYRPHLLCDI